MHSLNRRSRRYILYIGALVALCIMLKIMPFTTLSTSSFAMSDAKETYYHRNQRVYGQAPLKLRKNSDSSDAQIKDFKAPSATVLLQRNFPSGTAPPKRLIFIGDIHGCLKEFNQLLTKLKYKQGDDQIVLVGDLVAKGPDSLGVVKRSRQIGAWGVRGNHDDRVIRWRQFMNGPGKGKSQSELQSLKDSDSLPYDDFKPDKEHLKIAQGLPKCDFAYLKAFPAIQALPKDYSEFVVLHGGALPDVPLAKQDPEVVWTTRNIDDGKPNDGHDVGQAWFDVWGAKMKTLAGSSANSASTAGGTNYNQVEFHKVIYGHDAGRSLQIHEYTKGLDSRCVYGGQLTAFILPGKKRVNVQCGEYAE